MVTANNRPVANRDMLYAFFLNMTSEDTIYYVSWLLFHHGMLQYTSSLMTRTVSDWNIIFHYLDLYWLYVEPIMKRPDISHPISDFPLKPYDSITRHVDEQKFNPKNLTKIWGKMVTINSLNHQNFHIPILPWRSQLNGIFQDKLFSIPSLWISIKLVLCVYWFKIWKLKTRAESVGMMLVNTTELHYTCIYLQYLAYEATYLRWGKQDMYLSSLTKTYCTSHTMCINSS